ncbi:MAG: bifunctional tRNA (5-methylaminomethyl-2-thiouridine)(34)-methyltransferase MnmD/FAD-dependent 5-carboxymethylaminomethyl-2-thiouridine(34) oxidoreductase MnmC [Thiothrix sp.]|nr:MAG: bifunctional tRNA (5-methylaminomethyl-2-thiouridine)(34)-methyltransferase MnmD/FAD-dependent 5-carboxymethylaminomethyl-2-thiouridine(34) oxidoreductase MnmC [Thiothrix sp.]
MLPEISPANIELDADGLPFATDYNDRYFSRESGLAEARHVFLQGNHLPKAWQQQSSFVIGETGFGTGLNFLATWQAWQNDPERCQTLHYISFEKHPIPRAQLAELLAAWPELAEFTQQLLAQYPPVLAGFHQLHFAHHQVRLTLCFADAETALKELVAKVDAWYLDGFTPAKNLELWSAPLFQALVQHSKLGSTLASFTVAGQVRRDLQAAGFVCTKQTGFGQKREMLTAQLATIPPSPNIYSDKAWFSLPEPFATVGTATVIGAGIAGCQMAYALAQRGWQVYLLERHGELAQEASGNRAGVISPKMTSEPDWGERFYRQAFLYAVRQLSSLATNPNHGDLAWFPTGSLQLNHSAHETKRWQALLERDLAKDFIQLLDATEASNLAGIPLAMGGSYFPQAGYLYPKSLCKALVQHPLIKVHTVTEALRVSPTTEKTWQVFNTANQLVTESAVVVLANGKDMTQFSQTQFLPFLAVRGQTTQAPANAYTQQLKLTLGHEGYLTPALEGQHIFGASFQRGESVASIKPSDDDLNYQQLAQYLPEFAANLSRKLTSHVAIRMTTPDRYPYLGPLPEPELFLRTYAGMQHGNKYKTWPKVSYQPGLFISAGYGSRGLTTTALCSEVLAAVITGEPLPIERSLYYKMHPARFLLKKLQQQRD